MPSEGNVLSPPPRRLHSSNYINGFVYVFAGRQSTQNYHNDLWKLDLSACDEITTQTNNTTQSNYIHIGL
jgi:hypothetical protein